MPEHYASLVSIILIVSFAATLMSSMSGGGSSMITVPTWLMLGYPLPLAMATVSVSGATWTLFAAKTYLQGQNIDRKLLAGLIAFGLLGAFCGTQVVMYGNPKLLQRIVGWIILALVAYAFVRKDFGTKTGPAKVSVPITSIAGLPLGFYDAFFGSGNGYFVAAVLSSARGFDLLQALGYYYVLAFAWCTFAASIYIHGGNWNLWLMIPAVLGSVAGAILGSKIGKRHGAQFVKRIFLAIGTILGAKLAIGF
jgi:uncharacterized membrane protein YfcA